MIADTASAPRIDSTRRRIYAMMMQSFLHQSCVTTEYLVCEVLGFEEPGSGDQAAGMRDRAREFIRELSMRGWIKSMPLPDYVQPALWRVTFEGWVWLMENEGAEYG